MPPLPATSSAIARRHPIVALAGAAEAVALAPGILCLLLTDAAEGAPRFLLAALAGILATHLFVRALHRRVGTETPTAADLLTLGRAGIGTLLLALVAAGFTPRPAVAGWIAWGTALLAATALDWLDGPLARRLGPTRLGAALDIEADSWLTLWSASAAVAWGGLPWWVVLPPVVRYIRPLQAWLRGGIPAGGDPWWGRVTGVAQMLLLLAALIPIGGAARDAILSVAAIPVSGAQPLSMLALIVLHRPGDASGTIAR